MLDAKAWWLDFTVMTNKGSHKKAPITEHRNHKKYPRALKDAIKMKITQTIIIIVSTRMSSKEHDPVLNSKGHILHHKKIKSSDTRKHIRHIKKPKNIHKKNILQPSQIQDNCAIISALSDIPWINYALHTEPLYMPQNNSLKPDNASRFHLPNQLQNRL